MAQEELLERIARMEAELIALQRTVSGKGPTSKALETVATTEVAGLKNEVSRLTSQNQELQQKVERLEAHRVKPTPAQLVQSFRRAMDQLRQSLETSPESGIGYSVNQFDLDMKAAITVDSEDQGVRFVLPEPGDVFSAEQLSNVKFTFNTVPKPSVPEKELIEVPTLVSLSRETAFTLLRNRGLKPGRVENRESTTRPGIVLGQMPEGGDFVLPGSSIDLTISEEPKDRVPDVVGLSLIGAENALEDSGFTLGTVTDQISDQPEGVILEQTPKAGAIVAIGTSVDLIRAISEKVMVPNLIGGKLALAADLLEKQGLLLGAVTEKVAREDEGVILAQSPEPGKTASRGAKVSVTVSRWIDVPKITGKKLSAGRTALSEVQLLLGKIAYRDHETLEEIILEQEPAPPRSLPLDGLVNVIVARLIRKQVDVPNVVGMTEAQAWPILERAGLVLGTITTKPSRQTPGVILSQNPEPTTKVAPGSPISLVIATSISVPDLIGKTLIEARSVLRQTELNVGIVTFKDHPTLENVILEQFPTAKEKALPGDPVNLVVSRKQSLVRVPRVVDTSLSQGLRILTANQLNGAPVIYTNHDALDRIILEQSPGEGESVPLGSSVKLVVARKRTRADLLATLAEEDEFSELGISAKTLEARFEKAGVNSTKDFEDLTQKSHQAVRDQLKLRGLNRAATLKRLILSTLTEIEKEPEVSQNGETKKRK